MTSTENDKVVPVISGATDAYDDARGIIQHAEVAKGLRESLDSELQTVGTLALDALEKVGAVVDSKWQEDYPHALSAIARAITPNPDGHAYLSDKGRKSALAALESDGDADKVSAFKSGPMAWSVSVETVGTALKRAAAKAGRKSTRKGGPNTPPPAEHGQPLTGDDRPIGEQGQGTTGPVVPTMPTLSALYAKAESESPESHPETLEQESVIAWLYSQDDPSEDLLAACAALITSHDPAHKVIRQNVKA